MKVPDPDAFHDVYGFAYAMLGAMSAEKKRRWDVYGEVAIHLLDTLPFFRLSHSKKRQRCFECHRMIPALELYFVAAGCHVCQFPECLDKGGPNKPKLQLITGGKDE